MSNQSTQTDELMYNETDTDELMYNVRDMVYSHFSKNLENGSLSDNELSYMIRSIEYAIQKIEECIEYKLTNQ